MNKRDFLRIMGGGVVVAATSGCDIIRPLPNKAIAPWSAAGTAYKAPRKNALSYADTVSPSPRWPLESD